MSSLEALFLSLHGQFGKAFFSSTTPSIGNKNDGSSIGRGNMTDCRERLL